MSLGTRGARREAPRRLLPLPRRSSGSRFPRCPPLRGVGKRQVSLLSPLNLPMLLTKERRPYVQGTRSPLWSEGVPTCVPDVQPAPTLHMLPGSELGRPRCPGGRARAQPHQGRAHLLTPVPLLLSASLKAGVPGGWATSPQHS